MINIIFLGTSAMVPTKDRNHSAIFINFKENGILMDCGEGTQRQFKIAKISLTKVTKILITHWHGDHTLGLPGIIQSLAMSKYQTILEIYGPKGTKKNIEELLNIFKSYAPLKIFVKEVKQEIVFQNKEFKIECFELEHKIPTIGYNFIEKDRRRIEVGFIRKLKIPEGPLLGKLQEGKDIIFKGKKVSVDDSTYLVIGKKITYIPDTVFTKNCVGFSQNADVLICESTFDSKLEEKAREYHHMTAKQAALIANTANVKKLVLIHFSQRYKDVQEVVDDAKDVFENVIAAYDFMKIRLT